MRHLSQMDVAVPRTVAAPQPLAQYAAGLWSHLVNAPPAISLRFTCYLAGLGCFSLVSSLQGASIRLGLRVGALLMVACLVAGLACFYLASCDTLPLRLDRWRPHRHSVLLTAVSIAFGASAVSIAVLAMLPLSVMRPYHYANDAVAATECATHLFLLGHNPYTAFNLVDCFARHGLNGLYTTPLQSGSFSQIRVYPTQAELLQTFAQVQHDHLQQPAMFESSFNYPAGAFLLTAPFAALGWHDLSTFYLFWALLAYAALLWRAPRAWRPWLLLMAAAHTTLWTNIADGQSNVLDACLILAAWATWRRHRLSALLLGLAVATRQEAWIFTPFYLVLCGCLLGWREAARRLAAIAGVFGLVNAPFIALSFHSWLHGVLGPLTDPMYPLGQGTIALATSGLLPLWPRPVYTVVELAALVACLLLYRRICRRQPGTGPILALVPVVFAWRSLFTYFYVALPLVCLWVFLVALSTQDSAGGVSRGTVHRRTGAHDDPMQAGADQLILDHDERDPSHGEAWQLIA